MNKKILIISVSVLAIIAAVFILIEIFAEKILIKTTLKEERPEIIPQLKKIPDKEELEKKKREIVATGYGWSVKDNENEAVKEAISMVLNGLKDKKPQYLILFSNAAYDSEKVIQEIRKFLPKVQIYGGTSMLAVLTKDGFHQGKKASLAILAISSEKIEFGVGGADINKEVSAREAGKKAILQAISKTGRNPSKLKELKELEQLPELVLMTGSVGNEEEIINGIEEILGKKIPIIGGSGGDNDLSGNWKQFANDKIYSNGVALTAVFTDLKINWTYESGYNRTENRGIITKAKERIIYEIDNKPAAEVYNQWTEGLVDKKLKTGGSILAETTFYPLAKIIQGKTEPYYLSIHPLSINLPEKSLAVFTNVEEKEEILLMHGNWELLLNRAITIPSKTLKKIKKEEGYFGIYTYCAGTMLAIPEKEREKMAFLIKNSIGDIPFIGTFTFGEQGLVEDVGNKHGNLIASMIIFGPSED